ncbi:MAG: hypothetical protein WA491_04375 [Candidatus Acidiferrum sp.]
MTKFQLTVTVFSTPQGMHRAELVTPTGIEPITEWLPRADLAEDAARLWFDATIGPGLRIRFEHVRDLRRQD